MWPVEGSGCCLEVCLKAVQTVRKLLPGANMVATCSVVSGSC